METVKDSKEFTCLMKARKAAMERDYAGDFGWYHRKNTPVKCYPDGTPFDAIAKRTICEIEKLTLGLKRAYMACGDVQKLRYSKLGGNLPRICRMMGLKEGDDYRYVHIYLDREEYEEEDGFLERFFAPVVFGEKLPTCRETGGEAGAAGSFCAYPGGCD